MFHQLLGLEYTINLLENNVYSVSLSKIYGRV